VGELKRSSRPPRLGLFERVATRQGKGEGEKGRREERGKGKGRKGKWRRGGNKGVF